MNRFRTSHNEVEPHFRDAGYLPGFEDIPNTRMADRRTVTGAFCERFACAIYGGHSTSERVYGFRVVTDITRPRSFFEIKSNSTPGRFLLRNDQVLRLCALAETTNKPVYMTIVRWVKPKGFPKLKTVAEIENALFSGIRSVIRMPIQVLLPFVFSEDENIVYRPKREAFDPFYSYTWVQCSQVTKIENDPNYFDSFAVQTTRKTYRGSLLYKGRRKQFKIVHIDAPHEIPRRYWEQTGEAFDLLSDVPEPPTMADMDF